MAQFYHRWNANELHYYDNFLRLNKAGPWFATMRDRFPSLFPFSLARPGSTAVQVGFDFSFVRRSGSHPLILSSIVGAGGRVICIDANPDNTDALADFVQTYGLSQYERTFGNVEVRHGAIGSAGSTVEFLRGKDQWIARVDYETDRDVSEMDAKNFALFGSRAMSGLYDFFEGAERVSMTAQSLESVLDELKMPVFLNVTVSGYEPTALRTLGRYLASGEVAVAFPLVVNSVVASGVLDEFEAAGYDLIFGNAPHLTGTVWFPYCAAVRANRRAELEPLVPCRYSLDDELGGVRFDTLDGQLLLAPTPTASAH